MDLKLEYLILKYKVKDFLHYRVVKKIVWLLPNSFIYWAGIRLWANVDNKFPEVNALDLTLSNALNYWEIRS